MNAVAYGNNRFVAVGAGGKAYVLTAASGGSMSNASYTILTSSNFYDEEYIGGYFYAVGKASNGKGVIYRSTDGASWQVVLNTTASAPSLTAIAGGNA
jgi:hypothetical protein